MLLLITHVRPNVFKDADYSSMSGLKMRATSDSRAVGVESFNYGSTVEACEGIKGQIPGVFDVETDERTFGKNSSIVILHAERVGNVSEYDITSKGVDKKLPRTAPAPVRQPAAV
jgi:hypothetical protein